MYARVKGWLYVLMSSSFTSSIKYFPFASAVGCYPVLKKEAQQPEEALNRR